MTAPDEWDQLARLTDDADPEKVIRAARSDLTRVGDALRGDFDVALPFSVSKTSYDAEDACLTVSIAGVVDCVITASALLKSRKSISPVDLMASALTGLWAGDREGKQRAKALDHTWRPKRVGRAVGPTEHEMELNRGIARDSELIGQVEQAIEADRDVIIVGQHGSGRTATAAVAARELASRGYQEIWLNLTDPGDGPESIIAALMKLRLSEKYLLVVDGLQANLLMVRPLLTCVDRLRRHFQIKICIVATTLSSTQDRLQHGEQRFIAQTIRVAAKRLIGLMMDDEGIRGTDRDRFLRLAGNDVHIAAKAVEMFRADGQVPTEEALQMEFTGDTEDPQKRALLYRLACLGAFGQAVPEGEITSEFGDEGVKELLAEDLIHLTDGAFTLAPRKRARMVLSYALRHWPEVCNGPNNRPEDIVWNHLRRSDRLIRAALSHFDVVNIYDDSLRPESLNLLAAWELSEDLGRWLEHQADADPTWKNNLGSAVFAAMALSRLHRNDQWLAVAQWIWSRWHYEPANDGLPELVAGETTDREDFRQIAATMAREDATYWSGTTHPSGLPAADFDDEKAYRTWALGLLLCFEATAPLKYRDQQRIDQLLRLAGQAIEGPEGFYPSRIPWVTARVLIGISLCPIEPEDHPAVGPACRWLRSLVTGPDAHAYWWRGGTGEWNSDEATTSMCIIALNEADDAGRSRDAINTAIAWLVSREEQWKRPGQEIALAQVIEVLVRCTDTPVRDFLMTLLQRTNKELVAKGDPDLQRPEERLRLPFLAAQLTEIVWRTVRTEVKMLLRDVMGEAATHPEPQPAIEEDVADETTAPATRPSTQADGLSAGDLRKWVAAAQRLENTLDAEIRDRSNLEVATPAVAETLNQLLDWQSLYYTLLGRLDRTASRATLDSLDDLGVKILKRGWPDLPRPDVYCDEDAE